MGLIFNLIEIWEPYKAARMALSNTIQSTNIKEYSVKHSSQMESLIPQLRQLLKEGVLTEEFLLDNMQKLINLVRQSNVTLRWMLLHTNSLTPGKRTYYSVECMVMTSRVQCRSRVYQKVSSNKRPGP